MKIYHHTELSFVGSNELKENVITETHNDPSCMNTSVFVSVFILYVRIKTFL